MVDASLNKLMNGKVFFAVIVILVALVAFFVIRYITLKKYDSYNKELVDEINAIKACPNLFFLNKVKNMMVHDAEIEERYNLLYEKYNNIQNKLNGEIEPRLVSLDQTLFYKKIFDARKQYNELKPMVETIVQESTQLESELSQVVEIDAKQRNDNIELQSKYRQLQQDYDSVKFKVDPLAPSLGSEINKLEEDFSKLNQFLNDQNYKECRELWSTINTRVDYLVMNVRDLPRYIDVVEHIAPQNVEQIEKHTASMKEMGFALEKLDVSKRIFSINQLIEFIKSDIANLKIEAIGENVEKLLSSIDSLNKDLEEEENAKGDYSNNYKTIINKVRKAKDNYHYASQKLVQLESRYVISDPEMIVENKHDVLERLDDDTNEIKNVVSTKDFSYKEVMKRMKEIESRADEFQDYLDSFFAKKDEMLRKEQRSVDELKQINLVLLKVKSEIKNAHLPSISPDYQVIINDAYGKAAEIQTLRSKLPIDLEMLSSKTDEAINIINSLQKNVHNLIVTAQMVEETIVYGNRYRSDIVELNNTLTQVEILYRNGEYFDALKAGWDILNKVDPEYVTKIAPEDNPTK